MTLIIRPESSADAAAIAELTRSAFEDAAHSDQSEHRIVERLRSADALAVSMVAQSGSEIVGHVAFSPVRIADGAPSWFGLGPVSVLPARQCSGIGSRLINAGLDALRGLGAGGCVVLGEPAYYSRFGFVVDRDLILPGVPAEYFQALRFSDARAKGVVCYHQGFYA